MHATWAARGIKQLFPTLRNVCSETIEPLPRGLNSLSGSRIAIDGTLLVIRFAYAASRAHAQHVQRAEQRLASAKEDLEARIAAGDVIPTHWGLELGLESDTDSRAKSSDKSSDAFKNQRLQISSHVELSEEDSSPSSLVETSIPQLYKHIFSNFLRNLLSHQICPIFILDDPAHPLPAKAREIDRRHRGREQQAYRLRLEEDRVERLALLQKHLTSADTLAQARRELRPMFKSEVEDNDGVCELSRLEPAERSRRTEASGITNDTKGTRHFDLSTGQPPKDLDRRNLSEQAQPPTQRFAPTTMESPGTIKTGTSEVGVGMQTGSPRARADSTIDSDSNLFMSRAQSSMQQIEKEVLDRIFTSTPSSSSSTLAQSPYFPSTMASETTAESFAGSDSQPIMTNLPTSHSPAAHFALPKPASKEESDLRILNQARDKIRELQKESDMLAQQYMIRQSLPLRQLFQETIQLCQTSGVPVLYTSGHTSKDASTKASLTDDENGSSQLSSLKTTAKASTCENIAEERGPEVQTPEEKGKEDSPSLPPSHLPVPLEAEALASALVLAGRADLVLSEDSDVVIYGVPLLRWFSGPSTNAGSSSFELIHSTWARRALFPPPIKDPAVQRWLHSESKHYRLGSDKTRDMLSEERHEKKASVDDGTRRELGSEPVDSLALNESLVDDHWRQAWEVGDLHSATLEPNGARGIESSRDQDVQQEGSEIQRDQERQYHGPERQHQQDIGQENENDLLAVVRQPDLPPLDPKLPLPEGTKYSLPDHAPSTKASYRSLDATQVSHFNMAEQISRDQLVDFALLCGSDFCPTLPLLGPRRARSALLQHKSIEGVLQSFWETGKPKTCLPPEVKGWDEYLDLVRAARKVFANKVDLGSWEEELNSMQSVASHASSSRSINHWLPFSFTNQPEVSTFNHQQSHTQTDLYPEQDKAQGQDQDQGQLRPLDSTSSGVSPWIGSSFGTPLYDNPGSTKKSSPGSKAGDANSVGNVSASESELSDGGGMHGLATWPPSS